MPYSDNATTKKQLIEKFKGKFDKVDGGCTVIYTKSLQLITNIENLAIYTYLCSKSPDWIINAEEISRHFSIGIKKVYKAFKELILIGLLEKVEIREKGKFTKHLYYLNLSPLGRNG
ncbi:MAG: hypothetical protein EPO02_12775 [Nitrospirae bacterium]|nr:MAG: hypothetical protein EPO02_12775 [Nitrospirota bacterium]